MITLQFAASRGFVGFCIRKFTWSDFNHVDIVGFDGQLLGAQPDGGVKVRSANYGNFKRTVRFTVDLTEEEEKKFWDFVFKQEGKPYDRTAILGILLHRDWQEDDSWFCSELVAAAFKAAGRPLVLDGDKLNRITPRDLLLSPRLIPVNLDALNVKASAA